MAVSPESVVVGAEYRADDGEDRLVWAVRNGTVCYFQRTAPDAAWVSVRSAAEAPSVRQFAAEVTLVHPPSVASVQAANDIYGAGDW